MKEGSAPYSLCRAIKADPATVDLPVILVTSLNEPLDVVRALAAGADNFVTKPYDEKQLLRRLERTTQKRNPTTSDSEVTVSGEVFAIEGSRGRVLDVLVSALEDMSVRNAELEASREQLAELGRHPELQRCSSGAPAARRHHRRRGDVRCKSRRNHGLPQPHVTNHDATPRHE